MTEKNLKEEEKKVRMKLKVSIYFSGFSCVCQQYMKLRSAVEKESSVCLEVLSTCVEGSLASSPCLLNIGISSHP